MDETIIESKRHMMTISLEEYKDLLMCKGEVEALRNEIIRLNEILNNNMNLYCTISLNTKN